MIHASVMTGNLPPCCSNWTLVTISPSKLFNKLRTLGFSKSTLKWFWSYLFSRSCAFSQTSSSSYLEINLRLPQESVLSPFLFCLYINDLKERIGERNTLRLLYADDLQIYIQVHPSICFGNQYPLGVSSNSSSMGRIQ